MTSSSVPPTSAPWKDELFLGEGDPEFDGVGGLKSTKGPVKWVGVVDGVIDEALQEAGEGERECCGDGEVAEGALIEVAGGVGEEGEV